MFRVTICEENLQNSKIELEDVVQNALTLQQRMPDTFHKKLIDDMLQKCPFEVVNRLSPFRNKD